MELTSKELEQIEYQLLREQLLVKKFRTFSSLCSNAELKKKLGEVADRHEQHFNLILGFLQ